MGVVMSYQTWQRDYALDPTIVGSTFVSEHQSGDNPGYYSAWLLRGPYDGFATGFLYSDGDGALHWASLILRAFCIAEEQTGSTFWAG